MARGQVGGYLKFDFWKRTSKRRELGCARRAKRPPRSPSAAAARGWMRRERVAAAGAHAASVCAVPRWLGLERPAETCGSLAFPRLRPRHPPSPPQLPGCGACWLRAPRRPRAGAADREVASEVAAQRQVPGGRPSGWRRAVDRLESRESPGCVSHVCAGGERGSGGRLSPWVGELDASEAQPGAAGWLAGALTEGLSRGALHAAPSGASCRRPAPGAALPPARAPCAGRGRLLRAQLAARKKQLMNFSSRSPRLPI